MKSILIECIGFPGCGKTTFTQELERQLKADWHHVITCPNEMFWVARGSSPDRMTVNHIRRIYDRLDLVLEVLGSQIKMTVPAVSCMMKLLCAGGGPAAWKPQLNLLQYLLIDSYTNSAVRRSNLRGYCYVNSEGMMHHAGCLAVQTNDGDMAKVFSGWLRKVPLPDVLIHVSLPMDIARARMLTRGGPDMWYRMDSAWIDLMYNRWAVLLAKLDTDISEYGVRYVKIDNESDESRAQGVASTYAIVRAIADEVAIKG